MKPVDTITRLFTSGIKPSAQRVAVMDYLCTHYTHPTAEDIYTALAPSLPTLSKTTVYNTLRLLVGSGVVRQLSVGERGACFDANLSPHAHFLCRGCGRVFDLCQSADRPEELARLPEGFAVEQVELVLRGRCADCRQREAGVSEKQSTD